jgi:RNA polymerase sigma factor (sigma-70 family)
MGDNKRKLGEFLARERNRLVSFVRGLITETAERSSEDIVHDVITHLFDASDITIPVEELSAYVYASLRNKIIDLYRRKKREISLNAAYDNDDSLTLQQVISDARYDTESEVIKVDLRDRMYGAIDCLSEDQRAIVIMTEFEGRSFREISEEMGIPIGTLLARKSRALKTIREMLIEYKP